MPVKFKLESKEKLEKEHKEHKDKLEKAEKEHKDQKDVHKEFSKHEVPEYAPQTGLGSDPGLSAATPGVSSAAVAKLPEKFTAEKIFFKVESDKFQKIEKQEKHEKFEKYEYFEYTVPSLPSDPGGPVEQRLAALEAAMAQLNHFIPQELRPDLSKGALKQEPAQKPDEEKK